MSHSVLVTGTSKGIGHAIAGQLAADGSMIDVHYHHDVQGAQETPDAVPVAGSVGYLLTLDAANYGQCHEILPQDIEASDTWYDTTSNAGATRGTAFSALGDNDQDSVIHTNLDSFYDIIRPCIVSMIDTHQGGHIITLSSISDVMSSHGRVNYSAAKTGTVGATKTLAIELAKRKITVNCIAPGLIGTGVIEMEEAALKGAMSMIPMKRTGQAKEVVGLANCLISDMVGYVTRQMISINGGML